MPDSVAIPDALVRAAVELAAGQPPSTISGRKLAAEAGVNYGHVYHYFGGMAGVLRSAFTLLVDSFVTQMSGAGSRQSAGDGEHAATPHWLGRDLLWRALASFAAEPAVLATMSWDYPRMRGAVERAAARGDGDVNETRLRLAMGALVALGWMGYRQFVTDALNLEENELVALERWVAKSQLEVWP